MKRTGLGFSVPGHLRRPPAAPLILIGLAMLTGCNESGPQPTTVAATPAARVEDDAAGWSPGTLSIPDERLVNQDGEPVHFDRDLVKGRVVAINFVFSRCKGICPPLGANFGRLRKLLDERSGREIGLISISVDPAVDTPERLRAWKQPFGVDRGWTLLTGEKPRVDHVLKALQVYTADKNSHSPFILLGDAAGNRWRRVHGLTPPDKLADLLLDLQRQRSRAARADTPPGVDEAEPSPSPAHRYFTDVPLVNQHGEPVRLYSDLLKGKVVVISTFFTTCRGACPVLLGADVELQRRFHDRLGKDLFLISISVDPENDTPETLRAYADRLGAQPGWSFITGRKQDVNQALRKLGLQTEVKEAHSNIFIIGNERTGLWKKALAVPGPERVIPIVEGVLNDRG